MSDENSGSEQISPPTGELDQLTDSTVDPVASSDAQAHGEASTDDTAQATDPRTHRFECRSCGYVYDPAEGVKNGKYWDSRA